MKVDFITKNFSKPLEIKGNSNKILKELPKKVMQSRKEYQPLTDKLKKFKIRHRWEIAEGVSFNFKERRIIV